MCLMSVALFAQQSYKLTFRSEPEQLVSQFCCEVNGTRIDKENIYEYDVPAGASVMVCPRYNGFRPYDAGNYYTFREFTFEGEPVELSLPRNYDDRWVFTMPERDVTIVENFDYTPGGMDNPNPGTNSWNPDTQTLIFDDVTSSYFDRIVPQEDRSLVERIIVNGTFFTNDTFHDLHIFPNLNWLDLTRTTLEKVSKKGRWYYYDYAYSNDFTSLTDIFLPASVKLFEEGCFEGTPIQNLTILALTPPQLETSNYWDGNYHDEYKEVAFDNPDMVVFVPAEAVPIYKADKWWGKYDIQPVSGATANLVLNLMENPSDELLAPYRNMTIEMENIHTGQVRRMLVTSRNTYTFRSLPVNTAYTIRLKTQLGGIVGQIDNVYVGEEDATATFASLLVPHNLKLNAWVEHAYDPSMNVSSVSKTSVNDAVTISWFNADGNPIAHGASIAGVVPGQELRYVIKVQNAKKTFHGVPNEILLKAQFVASDTVSYTVTDTEMEDYVLQLLPLHRLGIYAYDPLIGYAYQGHLFEGGATLLVDGEAVNNYSILPREPYIHGQGGGGRLLPEGTYVISVKGDPNGPSSMSPENYAFQTRTVFLNGDMEQEFAMKRPTGNVIRLTAERQAASVDGQGRTDYVPLETANITVRDITHNRRNLNYSLSTNYTGGNIILADTLQAGTKVEVSVSYDTTNYEPQKATATVLHPDSIIPMTMKFTHKGNLAVRVKSMDQYSWLYGLLFDAKGELATNYFQLNGTSSIEDHAVVWRYNYTINSLQSGQYKLVLVNWSNHQHYMDRFHTMADVDRLLTTGKNCMISNVIIQDGIITYATSDDVPYVGDLQFFLDGSNSCVSYSKDQIGVGFMQTVKVNVAFQKEFSQRVSDVRLTFSRLGSQEFVNGSMMVGREVKADYKAFASNSELPLADLDNLVKFCVLPQGEGKSGVLVRVFFKLDGVDYSETLPMSFFNVKAATISAPKIISEPSLMVRGTTVADAEVIVMNGDEVIGQAKSNAAGDWGVLCTLSDPVNLGTYDINAKIKISGTEISTNAIQVKYDKDEITPKTVTMSWFNYHPVHMFYDHVVWDYSLGRANRDYYDFSNLSGVPTDINFVVDLTNNDTTVVKAVILTVFTGDDDYRDLECVYDSKRDRWVTVDAFFTYCLPVNIHTEVVAVKEQRLDAKCYSAAMDFTHNAYNNAVRNVVLAENAFYAYWKDVQGNQLVEADSEQPVELGADGNPAASGYSPDIDALMNGGYADIFTRLGLFELASHWNSDMNEPIPDDYSFEQWIAELDEAIAKSEVILKDDELGSLRSYDFDYSQINALCENIQFSTPTNVSHSALIAEGFVATLTTDGSLIYKKQYDDTHVAIVYPKANKRIDLYLKSQSRQKNALKLVTNRASSKDAMSPVLDAIAYCGEAIDELVGYISRINDFVDKANDIAKSAIPVVEKAIEKFDPIITKGRVNKIWAESALGKQKIEKANKMIADLTARSAKLKAFTKFLEDHKVGIERFGKVLSIYALIKDIYSAQKELREIYSTYYTIPDPCKDDQAKADELRDFVANKGYWVAANYTRKIGFDIGGSALDALIIGSTPSGWGPFAGAGIKAAVMLGNIAIDWWFDDTWKNAKPEIHSRYYALKCKKDKKKKKNPNGKDDDGNDDDDDDGKPDFPPLPFNLDPSGFVYEAVESNRVEGATATVYYKEKYKDMYGDEHERDTQWEAEKFGQVNPQTTDINGEYGWMVPQGLWQVKFEKEGYETTYSEWLPVPPPQLDVNVEMKQMTQPQVKGVKAYEKGVQIDFDKYMQPESLNADNIFITRNNETVEGTLEVVKAQEGSYGQTFAPAVRFIPNTPLAAGQKVLLTVKSAVKSYSGIEMEEDFQQEFDVEKRVEAILADSIVNVVYGKERTITVGTLPADAAIGKKMLVESYSTDIATTDKQVLTLNEQGQAQLTIRGELIGTTALRFYMEDDEDATALTVVGVRDSLGIYVLAPVASRASGSEVYYGTKIQLTSNTYGATIYYTLDGSCPCDDNNPAVKLYNDEEGIVIEQDNVTIMAMAIAPDMDASDIETYTYTLRKNTATYDLKAGWNWVSHNQRAEVDTEELASGQSYIVDGSNQRVSTMQALLSYQVYTTEDKSVTLRGTAWNPTGQTLTLESGWNWLGFPMNQVMTPAEALQYAQAEEGDMLVGQDGFSEFCDGQWTGTLLTLVPGKGYAYISQSTKTFYLNSTIVSTANLIDTSVKTLWPVNMHTYQHLMPVTAILKNGSATLGSDYVVGAFNDDLTICLGEAQWMDGRLLLLVNGEDDATIRYLAFHKPSGRLYDLLESSQFCSASLSSRKNPLRLTLGGENSGITEHTSLLAPSSSILFDLQGRCINGHPKHGVYIKNGKKVVR